MYHPPPILECLRWMFSFGGGRRIWVKRIQSAQEESQRSEEVGPGTRALSQGTTEPGVCRTDFQFQLRNKFVVLPQVGSLAFPAFEKPLVSFLILSFMKSKGSIISGRTVSGLSLACQVPSSPCQATSFMGTAHILISETAPLWFSTGGFLKAYEALRANSNMGTHGRSLNCL